MGYERDDRPGAGYDRAGNRPNNPENSRGREERGLLDRAGDEVRSWFGDEEAERRRERDDRDQGRYGQREFGRNYDRTGEDRDPRGAPREGYRGGYAQQGGPRDAGARPRDEQRNHDHDPGYRSWRDRQMEAFDRDYEDYRRENQTRFDSEFSSWRQNREKQRSSLGQVREHQEVVGSDGVHVGTVDHVRGDRILLTKTDQNAGGHHHSIPIGWIQSVGDKVEIGRTAEQALAGWRDEEKAGDPGRADGPHNLNRSFPGTY